MRRLMLVVLFGAVVAPAQASAAVRHAAPDGAGSACTDAAPCALYPALQGAADGDEVVLAPGDYGSAASPLTDDGQVYAAGLYVHGVAGAARPRIFSRASYPFAFSGAGVRVSHVHVVATGDGGVGQYGLYLTAGVADDVLLEARGDTTACFLGASAVLRNSACWSRGNASGVAVAAYTSASGPIDATLQNVTAWARNGRAIVASSSAGRPVTLHLTNVIAHGPPGSSNALLVSEQPGADAVVTGSRVNVGAGGIGLTAGAVGPDPAQTQTALPLLVDPESGNFRQQDGSPTVDAGTDVDGGPFAFGGVTPRRLGAHPDIGADEQTTAPATTFGPVAVTPSTAMVTGTVDPGGLETTYRFDYGPTASYGASTTTLTVPIGGTPTDVAAGLTDLAADTTYHVRLVATNERGTSASADTTFVTAPRPTGPGGPGDPSGGGTGGAGGTGGTGGGPSSGTTPPAPPNGAATPPRLSGVALTPARARARRPVRLKLRLDRDATVTIGLARVVPGRRKGTRCVSGASAPRSARRCTRTVPVRTVTRELPAGTSTLTLPRSFVPRAPGRYRVTVQAEAGGRKTRTTARTLSVLPR